jgi:hypothetical protein
MKVVPKLTTTNVTKPLVNGVGEVIGFHAGEAGVFFRVIWYGRPGVHTVHHSELEVAK